MPTVLLVGTLDTKGEEYQFVADRLRTLGCATTTVDVGVLGRPAFAADVPREAVAQAAGTTLRELVELGDRGAAVDSMAIGAAAIVADLYTRARIQAAMALGGSGGASIAARCFASLPVGFPKLIVSTIAAGDTRPFVGDSDILLLYPVVDLAGLNRVSEAILSNAAAAVAGMARSDHAQVGDHVRSRPQVGLTMFGVTTPCVEVARRELRQRGYDTLVFSANGVGGSSLERLVRAGHLDAVVDVTTTELADRLVGGILPASEGRLESAGRRGIPQVVSVGALDIVNFGPWDTVPARFRHRRLYRHNAAVTLMRTTPEEAAELGRQLGRKLGRGFGSRTLVLPLRGLSSLSAPGGPFHDPEADAALFSAVRNVLPADVELVELDTHINDPVVGTLLAERLDQAFQAAGKEQV